MRESFRRASPPPQPSRPVLSTCLIKSSLSLLNLLLQSTGNTHLIELPEIDQKLTLAAHVRDETLALIQLAKYRYLRRTYVASAEMGREDPFATVASRAEAEAARAAKPGLAGQKATDKA